MTSWHRNRRGRGCTTPRCRSQNIANNTFSEGWLQKSKEFAGLRTAPATHHAKNTANTTFSCGMLQNAGFGTIPCGVGGGGGSEPRTGNIYTYKMYMFFPAYILPLIQRNRCKPRGEPPWWFPIGFDHRCYGVTHEKSTRDYSDYSPSRWFKPWPFYPLVGGHQQPLKGSLNYPKKVTKNCRAKELFHGLGC